MAERGALERGDVAIRLERDLAEGALRSGELAKRYGCSAQAIRDFGRRHSVQIEDIKRNLADQYAGIICADPKLAAAILSQRVLAMLEMQTDPERMARAGLQFAEVERAIQTGIRTCVELAGQLPSRMQVQVGGRLDVAVNGIDVGDLQ